MYVTEGLTAVCYRGVNSHLLQRGLQSSFTEGLTVVCVSILSTTNLSCFRRTLQTRASLRTNAHFRDYSIAVKIPGLVLKYEARGKRYFARPTNELAVINK